MKQHRNILLRIAGITILILMVITDLLWNGSNCDSEIITMLRLPRILTALTAGGALALSGAQMQSILRNPLADPHIMGISAGAALGSAIATMTGGGSMSLVLASSAGAVLSTVIILAASRRFSSASTLLVFGVMLGFIVNAILSVIQFGADAESLKIFYSWSAGSFSHSRWSEVFIMAGTLAAGIAIALHGQKDLDILLFGDDFAMMTGNDARSIRIRILTGCCIMTGAVTAFCGPIGFVGIVAPHIARSIFKTSAHTTVIPASVLTGSIIAAGADLISQISPVPIPISSTMAFIGIPIILYILINDSSAAVQS